MSRLQEVLGPGNQTCYIRKTLMYHHPKYYKEMRKIRRAQALKLTSSQASGRKPSSPELRGQASSPNDPVPGSGSQGTSESSQASGNRRQG